MKENLKNLPSEIKSLYWSVPLLWPDSTIFILGGGPSIPTYDLDLIKNKYPVIGCNLAFLDFPWVDAIYFGDCKVHIWVSNKGKYRQKFDDYKGLKISNCPDTRNDPRIHTLFRVSRGITKNRRSIGWNQNTGASAINLAYHFGAEKIILLGFDMRLVNGRNNYHDYHLVPNTHPEDTIEKHKRWFRFVAEDAKTLGLAIVNATPNSALSYFPIIKYEDVLSGL